MSIGITGLTPANAKSCPRCYGNRPRRGTFTQTFGGVCHQSRACAATANRRAETLADLERTKGVLASIEIAYQERTTQQDEERAVLDTRAAELTRREIALVEKLQEAERLGIDRTDDSEEAQALRAEAQRHIDARVKLSDDIQEFKRREAR
ncbi:MAG TPA: hypothetical protein VGN09_13460 [Vicinamibacteria bacterium]